MGDRGTVWQLPPLRGWLFVLYRSYWCIAAMLALTTLVLSFRTEVQSQRIVRAAYDIGFDLGNDTLHGTIIIPFSPQARQVLATGEMLIAIDGHAFPAGRTAKLPVLSGRDNTDVRLQLLRPDGTGHVVTLRRSQAYLAGTNAKLGLTFAQRRWIEFGLYYFSELFTLFASALLFVRRPRDPVSAMLAASTITGLIDVFLFAGGHVILAGSLMQLVGNLLMPLGLVAFPDGAFRSPIARISAILIIFAAVGWGWFQLAFPSATSITSLLAIGNYILVAMAVLWRFWRTPPGIAKQQLKFAMLGFVIAMVLGAATAALGMVQPDAYSILGIRLEILQVLLASCANIVGAGGLLVSLLRYRLYDAENVISRSVAYGALTLALLAIFAGSEKIIEEVGRDYLGHDLGALAAGLGAAVAAILITPLHHRITHWAERRFQGELVHLRHGLPNLIGDIRETATPAELVETILSRVEAGVRASHGAVVAGGEVLGVSDIDEPAVHEWLACRQLPAGRDTLDLDRADPVFPMRVPLQARHGGMIGWLLLGPRPDGSFYDKDERETLVEIAEPIARALAIAIARQQREILRANEINLLRQTIAAIEPVIADLQRRLEQLFPDASHQVHR